MRFGSVCSGIEAASVAWNTLGWEAAWFSEIEKFPSQVLAHHYPNIPNLGDMNLLEGQILAGRVEAPDIFCGGTPCQAFSVAGKRESLNDERGNLSLTFCRIANAIDQVRYAAGKHATTVFWENVPGVLSTKDNAFGCFLAELCGEQEPLIPSGKRWTNAGAVYGPKRAVAWRVLNAKHFGVAQSRKRVFVIASARDGFDPAEILFESESLPRDTKAGSDEGKETTSATASCVGALCARDYKGVGNQYVSEGKCIVETNTVLAQNGVAPTLTATFGSKLGLDNPHIDGGGGIHCDTAKCLTAKNRMDYETETFIWEGVSAA